MSKNLTDVSTFTAAVHVPEASELVAAGTLEIPLQALANRTKYLDDADTALEAYVDAADAAMQATLDVYRGASGFRVIPFVSFDSGNADMWGFSVGNGEWRQVLVTGAQVALIAPIALPGGTVITRIDAYVGSPGHTDLPAQMPFIRLLQVDIGTGATVLDSETDSSSLGSYNGWHTISLNPISVTVDDLNRTYYLIMYGESSTDSIAGAFRTRGVGVYITPTP